MSNFIKKLFGTLAEKPWEKEQAAIDTYHPGKTFNLSLQTSAVIVIFGVSTVLFSLILTGYLYTMPPEQDIKFLFKPNLLWVNTIVLFFVTYFFSKIRFIIIPIATTIASWFNALILFLFLKYKNYLL